MESIFRSVVVLLALAFTPAWAQAPAKTSPPEVSQQAQSMQRGGGMEQMHAMDSMAQSMKAMADMCREMMERERAMMPAKLAAGAVFGSLLAIALILLIVLQVQWIIHWKRVLGAERRS